MSASFSSFCKICETIPSFLSFNRIAERVVRAPNFWGGRNWGRRGTPWRRTSTWRGWPLRRRRSFRWRCCAFGRQGRCWAVAWIGPGHERWRLVVKSGVVTSGGSILGIEKKQVLESQDLDTVGIWIPDSSGSPIVKSSPLIKWWSQYQKILVCYSIGNLNTGQLVHYFLAH